MNTIYKRNTTEKQLQTITLWVSNTQRDSSSVAFDSFGVKGFDGTDPGCMAA